MIHLKILNMGFYYSLSFVGRDTYISFHEIVIKCGFGTHDISYTQIISLSMELFSIFVLLFLLGNDIYKHFCIASVYFFSRCNNRVRWFVKESIILFANVLAYVLIIPLSCMFFSSINNQIILDAESFKLYIYYALIYTFFLYSLILGTNIISIKIGSFKGHSVSAVFLFTSVTLISLWDKVFPLVPSEEVTMEMILENGRLMRYNPITHLILKWHSSYDPKINSMISYIGIDYDLDCSVAFAASALVIVFIIGIFIIKKLDLVMLCKDMEG